MREYITLDMWMEFAWLAPVDGAEKYHICQQLSKLEANEIKHLFAQGAEFDLNSMEARQGSLGVGHPYRQFLHSYLLLMFESGAEDVNNWRQMLWHSLDSIDKAMMQIYARRNCKLNIKEYGCDR